MGKFGKQPKKLLAALTRAIGKSAKFCKDVTSIYNFLVLIAKFLKAAKLFLLPIFIFLDQWLN